MWDTVVSTVHMAPGEQRTVWLGAEDLLTVTRAAQVRQPVGKSKDYGVCAPLSTVGTPLRVPRLGSPLSTLDKRWVAAMVLNKDMGLVVRLPLLGELPAAVLTALPASRVPMSVADIGHQAGLPDAGLHHALLCLVAAKGRMSLFVSLSVQHVKDVVQTQEAIRLPTVGGARPVMAAG